MDGHEWGDVAYHIIIGWDGRVFAARPKRFAGDSGTTYDPAGHLLIVVEGNFNEHEPTAAQLEMLPKVTAWAAELYDADLGEISGHRDHVATTCPGEYLYAYIASGGLASDVAQLIDHGGVVISK